MLDKTQRRNPIDNEGLRKDIDLFAATIKSCDEILASLRYKAEQIEIALNDLRTRQEALRVLMK